MRCALTLAYDGTSFLGSQIQKETNNTVFGNLEQALCKLGINFRVVASGRTDRGVHATAQVCHIDLPEFWSDLEKFRRVLASMLPASIQIKHIKQVDDTFHARYSAKRRVYRYIIKNEKSNPFEANFISFVEDIDFDTIQANIKLFVGEHDFKFFMKTGSDVNSTIRVIYRAFAYRHKGAIVLNFEANGFLRTQIRLMVGALLQSSSAQAKRQMPFGCQEIEEQLACKKQYKVKPAPSNGLYLAKIKY